MATPSHGSPGSFFLKRGCGTSKVRMHTAIIFNAEPKHFATVECSLCHTPVSYVW